MSLNTELLKNSKSQLRQDIFVLNELNYKRGGFFVEFGATDGVGLSNTYLLEKYFDWDGILAEPGKNWHKALKQNRRAKIDSRCVWKTTGDTLIFNQTSEAELSTIDSFSNGDSHHQARENGERYPVETVSLMDLLEENLSPTEIDYLSIDTEGSEYTILENFDFTKYKIKIITCEHNFMPIRREIYSLLTQNGFIRKYENFSKFDDWYVRE